MKESHCFASLLMVLLVSYCSAEPMDTAFTYQGRLIDTNVPGDGLYDLQCKLFDSRDPCASQVGPTLTFENGQPTDGYFTIHLDFGVEVFDGNERWLEMGLRPGEMDDPNDYTVLEPRQEITPAAYALQTRGLFVNDEKRVGIGTTAPGAWLEVYTDQSVHGVKSTTPSIPIYAYRKSSTGSWPAVHGENDSTNSSTSGVRGILNSTNSGTDAAGVYGYNKGTDGDGYGVRGLHDGTGTGVYGRSDNGEGVRGHTVSGYAGYFTGGKNYFQGRVGVGAPAPSAGLHVKGTGYPNAFMFLQSDEDNDAGFRIYEGSTVKWHIFNNSADDALQIYNSSATQTVFYASQSTGNVGIGTTNPGARLDVAGLARVEAIQITGADVAEKFPMSETAEPGMVVVIDSEHPGQLCLSGKAYDRSVAGVVSGANKLPTGAILGNLPGHEEAVPVALSGRVWVNCDATNHAIGPGDLLTTSGTAGHAMAVTDYDRAHGAVLGKAMTGLEKGQIGLVLTLVNLQ